MFNRLTNQSKITDFTPMQYFLMIAYMAIVAAFIMTLMFYRKDVSDHRKLLHERCNVLNEVLREKVEDSLIGPARSLMFFSTIPSMQRIIQGDESYRESLDHLVTTMSRNQPGQIAIRAFDMAFQEKYLYQKQKTLDFPSVERLFEEKEMKQLVQQSSMGETKILLWERKTADKEIWYLWFGKTVFNQEGEPIGFLLMQVDNTRLLDWIEALPWGEGCVARIVTEKKDLLGIRIINKSTFPPFMKFKGLIREETKKRRAKRQYSFETGELKWVVIVGLDENYLVKKTAETRKKIAWLFTLFVLAILIFSTIYARTVTRRVKSNEEVEQSRIILRRMMDHMPLDIFWFDIKGRLMGGNESFKNLVEQNSFELKEYYQQSTAIKITELKSRIPLLKWLPDVVESSEQRVTTEQQTVIDRFGNERYLDTNRIPLRDLDGKNNGMLFTCRDVTEKQQFLQKERLRLESLDEELDIASKVLKSMLLKNYNDISNLSIESVWLPAQVIGGDFYDIISLGKDRYVVYLFDVIGHGVPAALNTALARFTFTRSINQFLTTKNGSVAETMRDINTELLDSLGIDRFLCSSMMLIDCSQGKIEYANAGSPPVYLIRTNGHVDVFHASGMLMGLMSGISYDSLSGDITVGDRLVFYTDGLTESRDSQGELYGEDRLKEYLTLNGRNPLPQLRRNLISDVERFRKGMVQGDDLTLIIIEITGPTSPEPTLSLSV